MLYLAYIAYLGWAILRDGDQLYRLGCAECILHENGDRSWAPKCVSNKREEDDGCPETLQCNVDVTR
jgi:hypothetical protein